MMVEQKVALLALQQEFEMVEWTAEKKGSN